MAVLHRLSAAYLSPRMRALGLKRGWIAVLIEVLERPGQSQDILCRGIRVDRAAMARCLFKLENAGYVTRREDTADRRQKLVFPTQKALDVADGLFTVLAAHNKALFAGFSPRRQEETLSILRSMIANLEDALS
ncbi:MAG: winged helix-turn-helix transcriptional regulator [Desulfovibrio sp.]|nr:winged helix-turn-helix transcriptional regulator [Desulfovibrio sp.]